MTLHHMDSFDHYDAEPTQGTVRCVACRHCHGPKKSALDRTVGRFFDRIGGSNRSGTHLECRATPRPVDPVTGNPIPANEFSYWPLCWHEREPNGSCGPSGRLWEAK